MAVGRVAPSLLRLHSSSQYVFASGTLRNADRGVRIRKKTSVDCCDLSKTACLPAPIGRFGVLLSAVARVYDKHLVQARKVSVRECILCLP